MLVVMDKKATPAEIDAVVAAIEGRGYTARPIPGGQRVAIGILHNQGHVEDAPFQGLPGVKEIIHVTRPYKLVSREFQPDDSVIQVGDTSIGNGYLTLIAGPCAIESEFQALTIARHVQRAGAKLFRGEPSSRELPLTLSKVLVKKDSRYWLEFEMRPACR